MLVYSKNEHLNQFMGNFYSEEDENQAERQTVEGQNIKQ